MADAGRILIIPKGDYDASVAYEMLDVVMHNDISWIAKKDVTGIEPSEENAEYWQRMTGKSTDADTLDGYHASEFVQGVSPYFQSGETILDWANNPNGVYKKFIIAENGYPSDIPVSAEGWCELLIDNQRNRKVVTFTQFGKGTSLSTYMRSVWSGAWREGWSRPFLPLDGSVPMSGENLLNGNGYGRWHSDQNSCTLGALSTANDTANMRSVEIYNPTYQPEIKQALRLRENLNGVATFYDVLHTGNSMAVQKGTSAPSDTSALWVVTSS